MLKSSVFILELLFLSFVHCQRYYAFVETLFVIDKRYFPRLSEMEYENYVHTIVNTANIVFQSSNDLDIRIEIIVSKIEFLDVVIAQKEEPEEYESRINEKITDYEKYDSVVLLSFRPWEGRNGAQGYAKLGGMCKSRFKILYLLPYQNAAFYLAHEMGHQLGIAHQVDTSCFTDSTMSVMTLSHTTSYERARWTRCENDWINKKICDFPCLFNKPDDYKINKNKYSTLPGQNMTNDQQAKIITANQNADGENVDYVYLESTLGSRCLYFQTKNINSQTTLSEFTPMLPGSKCGVGSICYRDQCVSESTLDSDVLQEQIVDDFQKLDGFCAGSRNIDDLKSSNKDPRLPDECVNWEDDFLCEAGRDCPKSGDTETLSLYIRHVCCEKCGNKQARTKAFQSRTQAVHMNIPIIFMNIFIGLIIFK